MAQRKPTEHAGRQLADHRHAYRTADQAIVLGAAVAAGLKARDESLREVVLTDVCPYTLGTQVSRQDAAGGERSGYFHPIIQRNSVVPVSREDRFYPLHERQDAIRID
ncbi:Hsp70 family protein, partial [Chromobacterium amazonense]|uniref:Hsp70 family protein n=1 Tax=Chromobacterium amazonense TaxID=1382803 RepID=UPI003D0A665A